VRNHFEVKEKPIEQFGNRGWKLSFIRNSEPCSLRFFEIDTGVSKTTVSFSKLKVAVWNSEPWEPIQGEEFYFLKLDPNDRKENVVTSQEFFDSFYRRSIGKDK
jgi:hypothetical protein